ncbi:MAG: hypothetical protein AB7U41_06615 [Dongiaceae bacterium]
MDFNNAGGVGPPPFEFPQLRQQRQEEANAKAAGTRQQEEAVRQPNQAEKTPQERRQLEPDRESGLVVLKTLENGRVKETLPSKEKIKAAAIAREEARKLEVAEINRKAGSAPAPAPVAPAPAPKPAAERAEVPSVDVVT